MNALTPITNPFAFGEFPIRTAIGPDGQVWFAAKDVCDALEITWAGRGNTLRSLPETWQGVCYLQTPGGVQEAVFISEAGVYKLAFRSNKPEAERFTNWVCAEVLPAIRRQGFYGHIGAKDRLACSRQILAIVDKLVHARDALAHAVLLAELRELSNLIGRPLPDLRLLGTDYQQQPLPL